MLMEMSLMLMRIVTRLKENGLLKTLVFLRKKLVRVQRHLVYAVLCTDAKEPKWLSGERVCVSIRGKLWDQVVSDQIVSLSSCNRDYLEAIPRGEAEGLAILRDGKVVHYAFLMYRNKTTCLLGFGKEVGLIGNAFTINSYRGRGCQARSVAARIKMAERAGLVQVISETSYDNTASQRGLAKAGMKLLGRVESVVLLNVLVIRYRRPDRSIQRVGLCW